MHLGGNLLYLWIFGNNIEDRMGWIGYPLFYLASGFAAAFAHILVQPNSTVPVVGASGAIAGVMGAYLVLFPNVRILSLIVIIIRDKDTRPATATATSSSSSSSSSTIIIIFQCEKQLIVIVIVCWECLVVKLLRAR